MREFFKPWRRKIGAVTLGLACVFAAAWMRSVTATDVIGYRVNGTQSRFILSGDGQIEIYPPQGVLLVEDTSDLWDSYHHTDPSGYDIRRNLRSEVKPTTVSYSILVLPLTLLSAYLLLSKPRAAKPKST